MQGMEIDETFSIRFFKRWIMIFIILEHLIKFPNASDLCLDHQEKRRIIMLPCTMSAAINKKLIYAHDPRQSMNYWLHFNQWTLSLFFIITHAYKKSVIMRSQQCGVNCMSLAYTSALPLTTNQLTTALYVNFRSWDFTEVICSEWSACKIK